MNDFFLGGRIFRNERQALRLPQEGENKTLVSNYFFTDSPAASLTFTKNLISASPYQSFNLLGVSFSTYCLTVAGALKAIDTVRLSVFGAAVDLSIPYPAGMVPATSSIVYQVTGNPQNKNIDMMFGDGVRIYPNQELTIQANYQQAAAFVATDSITGICRMYWSL